MVGNPAQRRAMRPPIKPPKAQEGRDKGNNDTPSFSEFVSKEIENLTSPSLSVVRGARTGRQAAEVLVVPLTAFEADLWLALDDFAEPWMSFEAVSWKAPGDRPRSEAASGVVAASSAAVVVVVRRPFAALQTGTAAIIPSLPRLVVSARNPLETEHKVCKRMQPAMARSVQVSSAIVQGDSGRETYQKIETSVAFDVEEPSDCVAVHVHGNAPHVAGIESEGDTTIRVDVVPLLGFLSGETREALVDSAGEGEGYTPSGALVVC